MNDKKFEKLVLEIMRDAETDEEPVTREEAEEMAKMELSAKSERHYEQSAETKPRKPKERKIDEDKKKILASVKTLIEGMQLNNGEYDNVVMKTETELSFEYNNNSYTIKLTKHRPPKK